jgi:hypothetical protein
MTEEEAKTKWCPMTRYHNNGDAGGVYCNKPGDPESLEGSEFCIASDCMMWTWGRTPQEAQAQSGISGQYQQSADGHCGLAK